MTSLPDDLVHFLSLNKQLRYDSADTAIGRVRLKTLTDLAPSLITTLPDFQESLNDPYQGLDGRYQIEVFDLIAESADYNPTGLLCWIPAVYMFGCVDPEHGKILVFPNTTWNSITADPAHYLDQQWESERDCSELLLPWLAFPFLLENSGLVLKPYPQVCPKHGRSVTRGVKAKPEMFDVLRRHSVANWLKQYIEQFPCSGLPVDAQRMLFCEECNAAEKEWCTSLENTLEVLEATPRKSDGWIKCPNCGSRFSTREPRSFRNSIHLGCGQKIRLREAEDNPSDYRADRVSAKIVPVVYPPIPATPALERTHCHKCGRDILQLTADKHGGLCKRCACYP